jgi:hypothetical protein
MLGALPALVLAAAITPSGTSTVPIDSVFAHLPDVHAVRLQGPINIDGVLDEPVWQQAEPETNFVQREPDQGLSPSQRTEVRLAYDDKALYVAARMWDTHPDSIMARLARRDVLVPADRFSVYLDPFHDRRNGYYFMINAAGTLYDGTLFNCDWDESSWDGVWQARSKTDAQGWTAEMRIPFSQLRFHRQERYLWGVNFRREIPRRNETDWIVFVPKNRSGFVSRFPSLTGIEKVTPGRYFEVLPYVTSRAEYLPHDPGDPFNDGSRYHGETGGDIRTGIGSSLTLNATVNPDFGQVEVDPAVVNLTDSETFFQEKRPFFVEGNTIFNFGNQGANNYWGFNWQDPKFFYTRRIGRAPQGSLPDASFSDVPSGARILGAGKITGTALGGWNVGMLHAVTEREMASFDTSGTKWKDEVEPMTYYGVARILRGFHQDHQGVGFMTTLAARSFDDRSLANQLSRMSLMTGMDGWTFLDHDKTWVISGWSALSHVEGNDTRMLALQQNAQHYFQRPDSRYLTLDSSAAAMTGFGTRLWLNKQSGRIIANSALGFMSPRFDVNDMGFQGFSGVVNAHSGWGYKWTENGRFKKYSELLGSVFGSTNFDGDVTVAGLWFSTFQQFMNNWDWNHSVAFNPQTWNDRRLRGGPVIERPAAWSWNSYGETDSKQKLFYFCGVSYDHDQTGGWDWNVNPGIEVKPVSSLVLRMGPNYYRGVNDAQYVGTYDDPLATATYGKRYVIARLEQSQVSADVSLNWSFSPTLSLQTYVQPLIASGKYTAFRELERPRSYDFLEYGTHGSTFDPNGVVADPDGAGPAPPIDIGNQDFNLVSLRGNAVLRWEFRPGSALFLVWTQNRSDSEDEGDFRFGHSVTQLGSAKANNIFLTKVSYYFGR